MSDEFDIYSLEEISNKIEKEWWSYKKSKIDNLSNLLGEEIIEYIPARIRTPIVEPSENTFSLKTYQGSEGEKYMVSCSNKLFRTTKRLNKKDKEETLNIISSLSSEPTGSLLPKQNKLKRIGSGGGLQHKLKKTFHIDKKGKEAVPTIYQYRCLSGRKQYRLIWIVDKEDKAVKILQFGTRNQMDFYSGN